jgi:type I restriction enzyme S subunit
VGEWRDAILGDVLHVAHGFAFKGENFGQGGPVRLVTPGNFNEAGGFRDRGTAQKSYDGPLPDGYVLDPGDIVIAMTEQSHGLLGSSGLVPRGAIWLHNQRIGRIRLRDPSTSKRFVYYLFNVPSVRQQINATATGTKVRHTAPDRISAVRVRLPSPATQARIAAVGAAFDDLIEINERRIKLLEDLARSLYREWFVRFRFPGHEGAASLVESELGPIPDGWSVGRLGDVAENLDRLRRPMPRSERADRPGQVPYYGAAKLIDFVDGWIFEGEHLLFAEDGSVQTRDGFPVLQLATGRFWANNHTHVLRGTAVSTQFLYLAASVYPIAGHVTGAAQPKITQANLNRLPVLVAADGVRARFDRVIDPIFDDMQSAKQRISNLAATRDLLLPRLVTGRLDISDIDLGDLLPADAA